MAWQKQFQTKTQALWTDGHYSIVGQLRGGDVGVRDDNEPAAPGEAGKLVPGAIERALFDQDVVAARVQRDLD